MKNITVKIDDEHYRRARVLAPERETSVSSLVRVFLQKLGTDADEAATEEARIAARRKRLQKLWDMADARQQPGPAAMTSRDELYDEELR